MDKSAVLIEEISSKSGTQAEAMALVASSLTRVSQVTHLNNAGADQSLAAAAQLHSAADKMLELVGRFKLGW